MRKYGRELKIYQLQTKELKGFFIFKRLKKLPDRIENSILILFKIAALSPSK